MEFGTYLQFFVALAFVLGLIALFAWVARRYGLGGAVPIKRGQARRLSIVEAMALDAKHRLVLVRRDDREHLLLIGGATDLVIESDTAAATGGGTEDRPK